MKKKYDLTWFDFHLLLKKRKKETNNQVYINLFKKNLEVNSKPYNRTYIKCPFCNGKKRFEKIHVPEKNDNISSLYVNIGNQKKRLGNKMVVFPCKGREYYILDIYYHILEKHEFVPRKWFCRVLLYQGKH